MQKFILKRDQLQQHVAVAKPLGSQHDIFQLHFIIVMISKKSLKVRIWGVKSLSSDIASFYIQNKKCFTLTLKK